MKIFRHFHNLITRYSTYILVTIIVVFAAGSMLMTVMNSASSRQAAINAKAAAEGTRAIVESQNAILAAIKAAEEDNKLTQDQKTNIIICMLQVPQEERVPKESDCRKQAASADTSNRTSQGTSGAGQGTSGVSSSSNNAPQSTSTQGNTSQGNGSSAPPLVNSNSPLPNTCIQVKPFIAVC